MPDFFLSIFTLIISWEIGENQWKEEKKPLTILKKVKKNCFSEFFLGPCPILPPIFLEIRVVFFFWNPADKQMNIHPTDGQGRKHHLLVRCYILCNPYVTIQLTDGSVTSSVTSVCKYDSAVPCIVSQEICTVVGQMQSTEKFFQTALDRMHRSTGEVISVYVLLYLVFTRALLLVTCLLTTDSLAFVT